MKEIKVVPPLFTDKRVALEDLKNLVKKFCSDREWDQFHSPKNLAEALIIEAAELLEIFRWKTEEESKQLLLDERTAEHVREELADILYFVVRFSQLYDIDLSTSFYDKLLKNEAKYPAEKVRGRSVKYTDLEGEGDT